MLAVALVSFASLAGCGSDPPSTTSGGAPETTRVTAPDCHRIPEAARPDIVFQGRIGVRITVDSMRVDASHVTRLTSSYAIDPTLSPDRCSVAFVDDEGAVGLVGADGKNRRTLVPPETGRGFAQPDWSPDGRSLVTVEFVDGHYTLATIDAATGRVHSVPVDFGSYFAADPVWSPDGKRIAFVAARRPNHDALLFPNVLVVSASGGKPERLTNSPVQQAQALAWSPNGRWIAFTDENRAQPGEVGPHGQTGILLVSADGSESRRATTGNDDFPVWASDSNRLVFVRNLNALASVDRAGEMPALFARRPLNALDLDTAPGGWPANADLRPPARPSNRAPKSPCCPPLPLPKAQ